MQGVGVHTAGENFAGVGLDGVVGAGQPGDGVEQDHHVVLVLDHPLGLLDDHLGHLHVALWRLVKGGADHLGGRAGAHHVGDFLRALVDQQDEQIDIGVVLDDGVGQVLHQHRLAGSRRRDNQPASALADRADQIHHTGGIFLRVVLEEEAFVREEGREVVEMNLVLGNLRIFVTHGGHLDEGKEAFPVLRSPDFAGDDVACLQIEPAYL